MENEGCWMPCPPFFSFAFSLHVQNVGGVATNAHNLYWKLCYYCRWRLLWANCNFMCSFPLFIYNALCAYKVWILDLFMYPNNLPPLVISSFARTWVLPSCTFFSPFFLGCFVLLLNWQVFINKQHLKKQSLQVCGSYLIYL